MSAGARSTGCPWRVRYRSFNMGPRKRTGSSAQAGHVLNHQDHPLDLYLNFQGTPYIYFTQSCSKILR